MAVDGRADILYCSSFSKTIAPGYRIGWIAAGRHMQKILESKLAFTLCCPALPQTALADFLSCGGYETHLRRIRRTFEDNIVSTSRTIEQAFPEGTRVSRPAGGFVLWVELPKPLRTSELFDWDERMENGLKTLGGLVGAEAERATTRKSDSSPGPRASPPDDN